MLLNSQGRQKGAWTLEFDHYEFKPGLQSSLAVVSFLNLSFLV